MPIINAPIAGKGLNSLVDRIDDAMGGPAEVDETDKNEDVPDLNQKQKRKGSLAKSTQKSNDSWDSFDGWDDEDDENEGEAGEKSIDPILAAAQAENGALRTTLEDARKQIEDLKFVRRNILFNTLFFPAILAPLSLHLPYLIPITMY